MSGGEDAHDRLIQTQNRRDGESHHACWSIFKVTWASGRFGSRIEPPGNVENRLAEKVFALVVLQDLNKRSEGIDDGGGHGVCVVGVELTALV